MLAAAEVGSGCCAARVSELIQERRRLLELVVVAESQSYLGHRSPE